MRIHIPFLFIGCLIITAHATAQKKENQKVSVTFDPLFWRSDLKLSKKQYAAIKEINDEFYTSLVKATGHLTSPGQSQLISSELIRQRSAMIWNVFSFRQKLKWGKISTL